jgi:hypothetical protein
MSGTSIYISVKDNSEVQETLICSRVGQQIGELG